MMKKKKNNYQDRIKNKLCGFCEKEGFSNRLHAEEACRLKWRAQKSSRNDKIKVVNSLEIQGMIACDAVSKN